MDPLNLLPLDQGFGDSVSNETIAWYIKADALSPDQRKAFRKKIIGLVKKITQEISLISNLNYSHGQKALQTQRLINILNQSAQQFYDECQTYDRMKLNEHRDLISTQRKIEEAVIDFTPFAPSEHLASASTSELNNKESHFSMLETINSKVAHELHHSGKKMSALTYEFSSHLLIHESEESDNPHRDRIISALSHLAIDKTIPLLLPKCLPAYLAISGSHLIAEGSKRMESHLEIIAKDRELAITWDVQYQQTGEGLDFNSMIMVNRKTLEVIQLPSHVVNKATETIKNSLVSVCDGVGLTEENIANITKDVMEKVVNDPKTLFASDPFLEPL